MLRSFYVMKYFVLSFLLSAGFCGRENLDIEIKLKAEKSMKEDMASKDTVTLGGGCFWCVEAVFRRVKGVLSVESGYSGGATENPNYRQVCTGTTGHAEVVQIAYNPAVISFTEILEIFFTVHDPTTLNRQGADIGTQYRSVIFYHNEAQKAASEKAIAELEAQKVFENRIVTEVAPLTRFYKAEAYHQNYYEENARQPYCQVVINPKLEKLKKHFKDRLK